MKRFAIMIFGILVLPSRIGMAGDTDAAQTAPVLAPIEALFSHEISTARKFVDMLLEFMVKYSFQVLGGIILILLGWFLAKFLSDFVNKLLSGKGVDPPVAKFIGILVKGLLMLFVVLAAMGKFGITIAPFIAGISVVGFGASFAVQGPLSNYAAGTTLIFTKPFKVGDIVEVAGVTGEVTDMTLARTQLRTVDGNVIFIPNKQIIGEVMHNYSEFKRLDLKLGVSYDSDVDRAIGIIKEIVQSEGRVSGEPEPKVGIVDFGDSSIDLYARLWCRQADYYDVLFDLNGKIFKAFNSNGIKIPFPQRDLHIMTDTTR